MSNWEKYQKPKGDEQLGDSIETEGMYMCHICNAIVMGGKYFPTDAVLTYKCESGHISLIEKVSFM